MATQESSPRWESRPWVARTVRTIVFVAPVLAAFSAVVAIGRVLPHPTGLLETLGRWVLLIAASTLVLWMADRALRRLLPIAALFRLSLVFPDRAPPRFKTALRSGTVRQLQRRLAATGTTGNDESITPQEAAEQLIALAATLNDHDRQTRGHTERVRAYSVMIGEELGLDGAELELLNWSGLVHDIGKLTVPPEILNKPGKPNEEEWAILRDHPARADALVEPLRSWLGDWAESATQHHERFDGNGYPNGLAGDQITLAGRIVAVADAYDVMTSTRSYKKPMPAVDARQELADNAGTQFDPVVVRAFLNVALGRLRLVMGPLTSLAQLPLGGASLGSTAATGIGAAASVGVATVATVAGLAATPPPPEEPEPDLAAFRVVEVEDRTVDLLEDGRAEIDLRSLASGEVDSISVVGQTGAGTVTLAGDRLTFTPEPDQGGFVDVSFRVCFVDWGCETGVVRFVIGPKNDPPVAWVDRVTTREDTPIRVDAVANDVDVDGDALTVIGAAVLDDPAKDLGPADVAVRLVDGKVLIEPGPDRWGSVAITYRVSDGSASAEGRVLLDVTPVDDPPVAIDDDVVAYENTTTEIDVLTNDIDPDGDPLTIVSIEGVEGGSAVSNGETVTFVPSVRHVGPAGLTYTVSDGELTARGRVDIEVKAMSDRPALVADAVSGSEDQAVLVVDVLANDVADGAAAIDPATVTVLDHPDHGTVTWDGAVFRYRPAANWSGQDGFRYAACDTDQYCNAADVVVTVAGGERRPVVPRPRRRVGHRGRRRDGGAGLGVVAGGRAGRRGRSVDHLVAVGRRRLVVRRRSDGGPGPRATCRSKWRPMPTDRRR